MACKSCYAENCACTCETCQAPIKPAKHGRLIGQLIDAWTLMPNSDQEEIREISPSLAGTLDAIVKELV